MIEAKKQYYKSVGVGLIALIASVLFIGYSVFAVLLAIAILTYAPVRAGIVFFECAESPPTLKNHFEMTGAIMALLALFTSFAFFGSGIWFGLFQAPQLWQAIMLTLGALVMPPLFLAAGSTALFAATTYLLFRKRHRIQQRFVARRKRFRPSSE